ncbi:hypothetical protein BO94DRAFT_539878 [Aspergillus sclerotioniger CBS 115572]|uniref:ER membrane protein complex subunit 10 n=1 Tax=Aspergillus sclerotioniger CBS 115572 TaxID=1450535 RepID=A0A317V9X2_9EURO|nr:hypothetical protein BO94DRAFT_539878 [Aspergillus sclerotioniger CBS 115572]PWY69817.1 hypothetical protein BO94DRAFT_539878 [Aspergillus sclerotioniger CBS 115572]
MRPYHFSLLPALSLSPPLSAAISSPQPLSAEILCWPVSSPEPTIFARVSYESTALQSELISYAAPKINSCGDHESQDAPQDLIRLGLYTTTSTNARQWVGTLASRSSLAGSKDHRPTLRLHIGLSNDIYYVDLLPSTSSATSFTIVSPQLELVSNQTGPRPHLHQPVILGPNGKTAEEVAEKTFFQKYWWLFLVITFLAMSGGGESQ